MADKEVKPEGLKVTRMYIDTSNDLDPFPHKNAIIFVTGEGENEQKWTAINSEGRVLSLAPMAKLR